MRQEICLVQGGQRHLCVSLGENKLLISVEWQVLFWPHGEFLTEASRLWLNIVIGMADMALEF